METLSVKGFLTVCALGSGKTLEDVQTIARTCHGDSKVLFRILQPVLASKMKGAGCRDQLVAAHENAIKTLDNFLCHGVGEGP
jgi:hypothetical protein